MPNKSIVDSVERLCDTHKTHHLGSLMRGGDFTISKECRSHAISPLRWHSSWDMPEMVSHPICIMIANIFVSVIGHTATVTTNDQGCVEQVEKCETISDFKMGRRIRFK